ncbi:protein kinase family protein [Kineococcus indalonis]|uniref:aminoglycoside phosphotransferase family protein n=1 Tax=Kineococcus indalonis TaxID=2696566 RepID=UPI001412FFC1|nr:aminoglycoside phosphotransferase family protein [Kineococcus indalonis]NAZ86240.1 aminoglycoside phosphotransferase family protein [Kineococcus indalonis]
MQGSGGSRLRWEDLPPHVRAGVQDVLGAPVVRADSQAGGFSPGSADRVLTATGRRAFVKVASAAQNPHSAALHRREGRVSAALPPSLPAPRLLGVHDDGAWVALVLEEVDGHQPPLPWRRADVDAVLRALDALARGATPCPVPELPAAADELRDDFAGFERLAADGVPLDGMEELRALARRGAAALRGDTLVHLDLRADNVLLTARGAVLVDWPHACRGPAWLDALLLLVEVERHGGHDADALLARAPTTRDADPDDLTAALAGFAAFFLDGARRPAPPGLPTVREFQRVQGEALLAWVRRRAGSAP